MKKYFHTAFLLNAIYKHCFYTNLKVGIRQGGKGSGHTGSERSERTAARGIIRGGVTMTIASLAARWRHIHADWWQDDQGNDIHRVEIDGDALYHCHRADSPLPWDAVTTSLEAAMAAIDDRPERCH